MSPSRKSALPTMWKLMRQDDDRIAGIRRSRRNYELSAFDAGPRMIAWSLVMPSCRRGLLPISAVLTMRDCSGWQFALAISSYGATACPENLIL